MPVRPQGEPGALGLVLPSVGPDCIPAQSVPTKGSTGGTTGGGLEGLAGVCRGAEALGASALWACDHLYWPGPVIECLTAVTVAATSTTEVTLGSCVLQLPLRSPAAVAKQAASLQLLSGGRFVLGIGVGSHRGEYEAAGADFSSRGQRCDEAIELLRAAWADGPASPPSAYRQLPPPPPVPLWVGGTSDAALARAARAGDGWVPTFVDPGTYRHRLGRLRQLLERAGRDPAEVTPAVVAFVRTGAEGRAGGPPGEEGAAWLSDLYGIPPRAFDRHLVAGTPERCAKRLAEYVAAGARHVAVMVAADDPLAHFEALRQAGALPGASSDDGPRWPLEAGRSGAGVTEAQSEAAVRENALGEMVGATP